MARKFKDEVTVIKTYTPNQEKMLEALKFVLDLSDSENSENKSQLPNLKGSKNILLDLKMPL